MRIWLTFFIAIFGVSCEKGVEPSPPVLEGEGEFFDPTMLEGAASLSGWAEVVCPGASKDERSAENPSGILRGEVDAALGYGTDVRVQLVSVDTSFNVSHLWHETNTDGLGRFCFKVPASVVLGPGLLLQVGNEGQPILRRMVLDLQDANVGAIHEALVQLVDEYKPPLHLPNLINLHTVGYTAVDLLNDAQRTSQAAENEVKYLKGVLVLDTRTRTLLGIQ